MDRSSQSDPGVVLLFRDGPEGEGRAEFAVDRGRECLDRGLADLVDTSAQPARHCARLVAALAAPDNGGRLGVASFDAKQGASQPSLATSIRLFHAARTVEVPPPRSTRATAIQSSASTSRSPGSRAMVTSPAGQVRSSA